LEKRYSICRLSFAHWRIAHPAVQQFRHDLQPECRAFGLAQTEAEFFSG
jgi:hypothetical protein